MKKLFSIVFLAIMLCMAQFYVSASANSWGLTKKLYVLFFVDSQGNLHVYTTAVYQPGARLNCQHMIEEHKRI